MEKSQIISEIERRVSTAKKEDYSMWVVGVTDTPKNRKDQHDSDGKKIKHWMDWSTDSEKDGRDIEEYLLDKGMKGDTGGGGSASYVYIF
ncbi:MAG: hypothetical protein IIA83_00595 [Thaumarchaeota archaeon]|nr:hypothetical protein [Nitrososphaerota archaeon]